MCQSITCWVQASATLDHETLACKHWQTLCLHWHMYLVFLSGNDIFCGEAST